MICPGCRATLSHVNRVGEPIIRNSGLVLKADGATIVVCPKCKSDVPFSVDLAKALRNRMVIFFKGGAA